MGRCDFSRTICPNLTTSPLFRTGSDHIREKDGVWAALAWLSVMEHTGQGIEQILTQHWGVYGRNYFTRYDYEECALEPCNEMMATLETTITDPSFVGRDYSAGGKTYKVRIADNFSYTDPVDKSVSTKQVSNPRLGVQALLINAEIVRRA